MLIENAGPKLNPQEVSNFEAQLSAKLPSAYKEFLSQFNGGTPTPNIIDIASAPGSPTDVQVFFGIERTVESSNLSWNLSLMDERCPGRRIVPIACDSGGNLFCLRLTGDRADEVVYCDLKAPGCPLYSVASSFSNFIERLRSIEPSPL